MPLTRTFFPFNKFIFYFQIEGFDDGGGRVIVKLAIGGLKVTINEFMVQPVAKQEFAQYGKILSKSLTQNLKFLMKFVNIIFHFL
jgi:hypothetical protein